MSIWVTPRVRAKYSRADFSLKPLSFLESALYCPVEVDISTYGNIRLDLSSGFDLLTQEVEYIDNKSFTSVSKIVSLKDQSTFTFYARATPNKISFYFPVCKDSILPAFLGNDLSLYNLLYGASLTFRGSSFVIQDCLFVTCGYSGSGKSTSLRLVRKSLNDICVPISDDNVHIHFGEDRFRFVAPIWDPIVTQEFQPEPLSAGEINFIVFSDLIDKFEIKQLDPIREGIEVLLPHVVWAGRNHVATVKIFEILDSLLTKATVSVINCWNYSYYENLIKTYESQT